MSLNVLFSKENYVGLNRDSSLELIFKEENFSSLFWRNLKKNLT